MDILTKLVIRILKGADFTHEFASIFLVILETENFKNSLRCPRITQTKYYDFFKLPSPRVKSPPWIIKSLMTLWK
jgi:hypothetical protein